MEHIMRLFIPPFACALLISQITCELIIRALA